MGSRTAGVAGFERTVGWEEGRTRRGGVRDTHEARMGGAADTREASPHLTQIAFLTLEPRSSLGSRSDRHAPRCRRRGTRARAARPPAGTATSTSGIARSPTTRARASAASRRTARRRRTPSTTATSGCSRRSTRSRTWPRDRRRRTTRHRGNAGTAVSRERKARARSDTRREARAHSSSCASVPSLVLTAARNTTARSRSWLVHSSQTAPLSCLLSSRRLAPPLPRALRSFSLLSPRRRAAAPRAPARVGLGVVIEVVRAPRERDRVLGDVALGSRVRISRRLPLSRRAAIF